jgi:general stress protein YciG
MGDAASPRRSEVLRDVLAQAKTFPPCILKNPRQSAGQKGGCKTKERHGHDFYVEIGRKGGKNRKHPSAKKEYAASDFKIGMRIEISEAGRKAFPRAAEKSSPFATVRGFSHDGICIRVQRDGAKSTLNYHPNFWIPLLPNS